jgi:hypothetical protein
MKWSKERKAAKKAWWTAERRAAAREAAYKRLGMIEKKAEKEYGEALRAVAERKDEVGEVRERESCGGQKEFLKMVVLRVPFNPRMVECVPAEVEREVAGPELVYVGNNSKLAIGDVLECKAMEGQLGFWEFVRMVDDRLAIDEHGLPRDRRRPRG